MLRLSLFRRLAATFAAVTLAASAHAFAGDPPPDPDTTAIGYIQHVVIGTPACETCPPRVCPGEPVVVTISGVLPNACVTFRGFRELPVGAPFTVLQADFEEQDCGTGCPLEEVPFSARVMLPAALQPSSAFLLLHQVRGCPDTLTSVVTSRQYTYQVEPNCVVVPPVDSLVRTFVSFEVTPDRRCSGDSLWLKLKKNGCPPCVHLTSFTGIPGAGFHAEVEWRPLCAEFACRPESLSVPIGVFAAGSHLLRGSVDVRVLDTANPDSVISFSQRVGFNVSPDCVTSQCYDASLPPAENRRFECAVTIPRGETGVVTLPVRTGVGIFGAQGYLNEHYPLRIVDIQYAGVAPGTFVTWQREGGLVRFVAFTTENKPMLPKGRTDFLRVTLRVEPDATPDTALIAFNGVIEQAAGLNGEELSPCPVFFRDAPPTLFVCIGTRDDCDANGDGLADVRDLVRMVSCLRPDSLGVNTPRVCRDCNRDGRFDLTDLFCCAHLILRAPRVPRDSVHVSDAVQVAFGTFRRQGGSWRVPVRVRGAGALAGSLLRLRYPSERWRAEIPVELAARTFTDDPWLPIVDTGEPGVVQMGWLKLGQGERAELEFELAMIPRSEPLPGDELSVELADLVLPDGTTITPAEALPVASLTSPSEPPEDVPARLELGPARPNPFSGSTHFAVSLPREATVELTVHDVAGRVVATLARGRFAAGVREFAWDGAGASEGVYFARLSVEGRVISRRVALLRNGR